MQAKIIKLTTGMILLLWTFTAAAADAAGTLMNGGNVTVDPDSNRATVTVDGVSAPLWDGTHRMQDGSILIIRDGISVPTEAKPALRSPPPVAEEEAWEGAPIVGYSPCERLVRRVCGAGGECAADEACNLAGQLRDMEQQERTESPNPNRMTYTSGSCQVAHADRVTFPACAKQAQDQR